MAHEPVLIAGEWRAAAAPAGWFQAVDPSTRAALPETYPVSSMADLTAALEAAREAVSALGAAAESTERVARFLETYAAGIEDDADALVALAARETGLPVAPRLGTVELPRTTNQLRQGAAAARARSWCQATIDTKANLRSCFGPLGGPVVVFGPNNFPFAFNSVAGGDFVAAIAAGNPVIAKANTGHPGTTRRLAALALDAARAVGLPPAMVQLVYRTPPDAGFALVAHPAVGATAFTGGKSAGLSLKAAADAAGKPIYLEMSSTNPVFVLPGALDERLPAIAKEITDSCLLGAGQFCTRPGLIAVEAGPRAEAFIGEVKARFEQATPGTLLGADSEPAIAAALGVLVAHGARVVTGGHAVGQGDAGAGTGAAGGARFAFANTLLRVPARAFLADPHALQTEAFGAVATVIVADDAAETIAVAARLDGNLTGCIYSDSTGRDDALYARLAPVLLQKVGRLLNDKVPTGVAVSPAMNHGGPYPATGHPGFTAVGIPASLLRFAALRSYDNVRPHRLPVELRNPNPTGAMWRMIDGAWSQGDVPG